MVIPYCGAPPAPADLWLRWKFDPLVIGGLLLFATVQCRFVPIARRATSVAGWLIAALALLSPLCALSVSLFSARVLQHLVLGFIAAPLIASSLSGRAHPWLASAVFALFLWFWHMPVPYDATLHDNAIYWSMHLTLFASAVWLWQALLADGRGSLERLAAGIATSMQMGLLGAFLALASYPLFSWHLTTTAAWGLSPLADQQLGGVLMWVPGGLLLLWQGLREGRRLTYRTAGALR